MLKNFMASRSSIALQRSLSTKSSKRSKMSITSDLQIQFSWNFEQSFSKASRLAWSKENGVSMI